MKKILAILLTVLMAFTVVVPVSAADTDVAAIGETTYATLQAAIDAAAADDTVKLIKDVTENATITKKLTLDGDGKQYTGKITLNKVNATIQNVNFVDGQIYKSKKTGTAGTVTVKNCNFEGAIADNQYAINLGAVNNIIIEDCNAKDVGFGFFYAPSTTDKITVKNVNIDGASYGIHIVYNNSSTIENVTMKNVAYGVMIQTYGAKTITFKNCSVDAENPVYIWERNEKTQTLVFEGENDFGTDDLTFGSSLVTYTADVAKVGDTAYKSLQEAIDACVAGDNTIKLLTACDETVTIKQQKDINIVLDGNGKTYSGTIKVDGNNRPTGAETLTIKNVKFENTAATTYAYFINATKNAKGGNSEAHNVTVDSCSFKSNNWHYAIATRHPYNLVVKNCTAENVYYLIYNPQGGEKIAVEDCTVTGATYGIGSQKCKEVYVKNYTYSGKAAGIYGRSTVNGNVITMENVDITTTLDGQSAITLWKNNDGGTSKTFTFIFLGDNNKLTVPEGTDLFARQSATNSPYVFIHKPWVAAIGDAKYLSLKEAIAAAADGDTVTVIADHEIASKEAFLSVDYPEYYVFAEAIGKKVTIDLNGKVITVNPELDKMMLAVIFAGTDGEVILKDSSEAQTGAINVNVAEATKSYSIFTVDGGKFTIEGGNYYLNRADSWSMLYAGSHKEFTVTGGNFVLGNADTKAADNGELFPWITNVGGDGLGSIEISGGTYNVDPTHYHGETYYPGCYAPVEEGDKWIVTIVHTPGDAATCQAAQTCTVCGEELDAIKDHTYGEYVSDGNATCEADGTKTAECIYGCGTTDTVVDAGSKGDHADVDGDGNCDGCNGEFCDTCGRVHEDWISKLICLIVDFVNLVISFIKSVK